MPIFRIISTRRINDRNTAFEVEEVSGQLSLGDEFRCYDTHHPADYRVVEVKKDKKKCVLVCAGRIGFEGLFEGAIVDTAYKSRGTGFHYERNKEEA